MNEYQQALMRIIELEDKNAELKRIYRRIQEADHPGLELPVEMTIAMAEMTALLTEEEN